MAENYPVATVPVQTTDPSCVTQPPVIRLQHSEAEEAFLNDLYAQLKPEAVGAYVTHFISRTPAHLVWDMKDLLKGDLETPPSLPPEVLATPEITHPREPAPAPIAPEPRDPILERRYEQDPVLRQ